MDKTENKITRTGRSRLSQPGFWPGVAVVLAVIAIYGQSLWFDYVNYDDVLILSKRWIEIRELSWVGLQRMFSFTGLGTFQPLRHLAFAVVHRFTGTEPWGYHLFNLLFYLANLGVVFLLLRKLFRFSRGFEDKRYLAFWSWAGTAWFAVHPLHVESVAWMISNKEMLAGLFYFAALLSYLKSWEREFSFQYYLLSWVFLALGMLSKPSVAALPLVVVAFEILYRRQSLNWKLLALRTVPFLALVGAGAVFYVFFTTAFTGLLHGSLRIHSLSLATVLAKYIKILLLPVNLCNSYPPPYFFGEYNYKLAFYLLVDLGLFVALIYSLVKGRKEIAFGILFFLLNLLPVSGIFPISIFMADRYLYLSSLGFIFVGIVLLSDLWNSLRANTRSRRWFALGGICFLLFLTLISTVRCRAWKDSISLWSSAVRTYPNFQFNHYALGTALRKEGYPEAALNSFLNANLISKKKLNLEHLMTTYHIASILDELGDSASAESYYLRVLELYDRNTREEHMLAAVYTRLGRMDQAAEVWVGRGKRLKNMPEEVKNCANKLLQNGYTRQAEEVVAEAVPLSSPSAGMGAFLAEIQVASGEYGPAARTLEQALAAGEDSVGVISAAADMQFGLGNLRQALDLYAGLPLERLNPVQLERVAAGYYRTGRLSEALRVFRFLLYNAGKPVAIAHNNVGVVLEAMDSLEAAGVEYRRAVELEPDYADAWFNLGNLAVKLKNPQAALEYYTRARSLEGFSVDVESGRGKVLLELGLDNEAFEAYRGVLAVDSTNTGALLGAADALWRMGQESRAGVYYRRLGALADRGVEVPEYAVRRAQAAGP